MAYYREYLTQVIFNYPQYLVERFDLINDYEIFVICFNLIVGDYSIDLTRDDKNSYGFLLKKFGPGNFKVVDITPRSPADINGKVNLGDTLVAINDKMINEFTDIDMITEKIRKSGNSVRLRLTSRLHVPGTVLNLIRHYFLCDVKMVHYIS